MRIDGDEDGANAETTRTVEELRCFGSISVDVELKEEYLVCCAAGGD